MTYPITLFIQQHLQAAANEKNAQAMAAYMKTTMPFYGVKAAEWRSLVKQALKKYPIASQKEYFAIVNELWSQPHREEKYIAIDIARIHNQYLDAQSINFFENMIREGAWWDFVDHIAIHIIGTILMRYPRETAPIIDQWIHDEDKWIRRTSIICQNSFKRKTNTDRLFSLSLRCAHEKEFFIRKAIGWALREYAKTDQHAVKEFIDANKERLSPLSYREASRHFCKNC
jgi:3-methyladenine DNA glycosylase AlkD